MSFTEYVIHYWNIKLYKFIDNEAKSRGLYPTLAYLLTATLGVRRRGLWALKGDPQTSEG